MNDSICTSCSAKYQISTEEKDFLDKNEISIPDICPKCRLKKRMIFRNESSLYSRECDLCSKNIISIYEKDREFPVYCQDCYWSDKWDGLDYAAHFDEKEDFFNQIKNLMNKVPRLAIINKQCQNSEYCNYSFANKNCHLTFGNHYEEDCLYGHYSTKNKDCLDYLYLYQSELSYKCIFSSNCYHCAYLDHCNSCSNCYFSMNLTGCKNCLFCANLRHKEFCIFNKQFSQDEYYQKLEQLNLADINKLKKAEFTFDTKFKKKFPYKAIYQTNCESCLGSELKNSKNLIDCFDCANCQDCINGIQMDESYDSIDCTCMGYDKSELAYQCIGCSGINNCIACESCWHNNDLAYSQQCFSSSNCLASISLQKKEYCILNKQYSKEDYFKIYQKIKTKMLAERTWGSFFPSSHSPFSYKQSIISEYFPRTNESEARSNSIQLDEKMYSIESSNGINDKIFNCHKCSKQYKITKKEFVLHQKLNIALPEICYKCRHAYLLSLRGSRCLQSANCYLCKKEILSAINEEEKQVYCEDCFLKNTY